MVYWSEQCQKDLFVLVLGKESTNAQAFDMSIKSEYVENLACSSIFKGVHAVPEEEVECGKKDLDSCETATNGAT